LADPFIIGASSGAALGVALTMYLELDVSILWFSSVPVGAFVGSLLTVAGVYFLAGSQGSVAPLTLLLAGASVSSVIAAVVSMLMLLTDDSLVRIFSWLMGSVAGHGWPVLWTTAPCIVAGCVVLQLMARPLDALSFGEETARSLGLPVHAARGAIVVAATLVTAAGVSAAGVIGFVGLVAPHIARLLVGAHHVRLLPVSGLIGAILLLLADDLARTVLDSQEVPLGIITALVGGPFFLVLLKQYHRRLGG
jgi:iron complex transport system permease protein